MTQLASDPTILIIDDTPSNLSVVVDLLEDRGYRVSIAQDGKEGLQRAKLLRPDLIMLDVMMPEVDGFEICRRLKEEPLTRDVPVIFMTALASTEHKVKGFQAGAVDYVTKPLQIDEVLARVETHLKLHAAQKKLAEQNEELERRVAERTAELAAREREFRTLAENHPDGIVRLDLEGRHLYVNDAALHSAGLTEMALLGKTVCELPVPGNPVALQPVFDAHQRVVAGGRADVAEFTWPNGRTTETRHIPEFDGHGRIVSVLALGRDITERKQAERELQLLNRAVNTSSEAAFLMDAKGRFVYVNDEACRSLGYSREELLGMTPLDIDPDITAEIFGKMLDSIFSNSPVSKPLESRHRARDGRVFPIEIAPSPITLEGENYCLTMVRDISARKQAECQLHEQQQAILAMVENSPDTIVRYDSQCRRIYLNPAMAGVFGLPREQLLGTSPSQSSPLPGTYLAAIKKVLETGTEQRMESSFRHADGSAHWVDLRLAPEFDANGKVATVLAIGRDITERKFAEQALAASEREFRTLVENVPDNIARHDLHGRLVYINPKMQRTFQRPAAELYGKTPQELHPGSPDARAYLDCILGVAQTGISREYEMTLAGMGDGPRYHSILLVAECDADDKITGVLTLGRDITERKRTELDLHLRNRALDNAFDAVYLVDEELRLRYANDAASRVLGYSREELSSMTLLDIAPDVTREMMREVMRQTVEGGEESRTLESRHRRKDGTIFPVEVGAAVFNYEGETLHLTAVRNITERKRIELALQESRAQLRGLTAQREEMREEERKHIAREVHDELGQLLTGLKLNVSVLAHMLSSGQEIKPERLQESLQLTDRALQVARNVASALRPAALDMGVVSALEWLAGRFSMNTGIQCELSVLERDIQLEENQAVALFRIVQESLTNVSRHAQAHRVDISLIREGDDYVMKVRDNGRGFDANMRKAESFGLVGIRERALLLGGTVDIESRPGDGTEVVIRIPVQKVREGT
jgi:PAS domain S-box-containing protein